MSLLVARAGDFCLEEGAGNPGHFLEREAIQAENGGGFAENSVICGGFGHED